MSTASAFILSIYCLSAEADEQCIELGSNGFLWAGGQADSSAILDTSELIVSYGTRSAKLRIDLPKLACDVARKLDVQSIYYKVDGLSSPMQDITDVRYFVNISAFSNKRMEFRYPEEDRILRTFGDGSGEWSAAYASSPNRKLKVLGASHFVAVERWRRSSISSDCQYYDLVDANETRITYIDVSVTRIFNPYLHANVNFFERLDLLKSVAITDCIKS